MYSNNHTINTILKCIIVSKGLNMYLKLANLQISQLNWLLLIVLFITCTIFDVELSKQDGQDFQGIVIYQIIFKKTFVILAYFKKDCNSYIYHQFSFYFYDKKEAHKVNEENKQREKVVSLGNSKRRNKGNFTSNIIQTR